jgi:hypothetical protein
VRDLPVFPLNTVLFPGGRLPLRIFEQRYMEMAKACLRDNTPFGVCLIREGAEVLSGDTAAPAVPASIGCLARIADWDMPQLGVLHVVARGERRFRILERRTQADGLARADVELLPEETDAAVPESCARCARLLEHLLEQQPALFESPSRLDSSTWVSARLAEVLPLPLQEKQKLLELADGAERLEHLNSLLAR